MSHPKIIIFPDQLLSTPTRAVTEFDSNLISLVKNLVTVMVEAPGVGVAANQIGIDLAVAVIGIPSTDQPLVLVNPEIVKSSKPVQFDYEGCLSLPGYWGSPMRSERVRVDFQDALGNSHTLDATEYLAQVIQHETDHLNGYVFEQRLPDGDSLQATDSENPG
jgi:peptide deformylase